MISRKHWSPGSDVSVQSVERRDSGGWTVSGSLTPNGICPDCGLQSRRRHGWRRRRLQDYPAHGDGVTVTLWVCRWRCLAPACPRRTFSDQIGSIARPFARRTSRVGEIVSHLGHATGGRPAERLLHRLGLGVSDDTVLRRSCRECGGNWRAARSEHVTLAPVRPRGQETSAREAEKGFPSHRLFASGSALTPGAPRAASARFQRRAARSGS